MSTGQLAPYGRMLAELRLAAGDREMLLTLSRRSIDDLIKDPRQAVMWVTQAVTYARLAALSEGATFVEMRQVASVLFYHAQLLLDQAQISARQNDHDDAAYFEEQSNEAQAEAVYWLNLAADMGDEDAGGLIIASAELLDPRVMALASVVSSQSKEPAGV